eukprot:2889829-Rhodomonas_salina.1
MQRKGRGGGGERRGGDTRQRGHCASQRIDEIADRPHSNGSSPTQLANKTRHRTNYVFCQGCWYQRPNQRSSTTNLADASTLNASTVWCVVCGRERAGVGFGERGAVRGVQGQQRPLHHRLHQGQTRAACSSRQ